MLAAVVAHARAAAPLECCGLFVGTASAIVDAVPVRNTADEPRRRYRIDPEAHFGVIRDARARGLAVLGAYHSHPAGPPHPSDRDAAEAFEDFLFVIISLQHEAAEVTGWFFVDGNFVPASLVRSSRR